VQLLFRAKLRHPHLEVFISTTSRERRFGGPAPLGPLAPHQHDTLRAPDERASACFVLGWWAYFTPCRCSGVNVEIPNSDRARKSRQSSVLRSSFIPSKFSSVYAQRPERTGWIGTLRIYPGRPGWTAQKPTCMGCWRGSIFDSTRLGRMDPPNFRCRGFLDLPVRIQLRGTVAASISCWRGRIPFLFSPGAAITWTPLPQGPYGAAVYISST
jgi:hypothetical protein